ncbi:DUF488 family protein [Streptomyces sp. NPDC002265]|uniref:SLAC1 family transporter n=1 Tax=Streptomyces sp. NPDC002265 TaxID=3154415 RepID=UPI00331837E6
MGRQITYRRMTEPTSDQDGDGGRRVLVDRLWPEGLRRQAAPTDEWLSDIAPSRELQDWYGRHLLQFDEFRRRYLTELTDQGHQHAAARLRGMAERGNLTLLTAARDMDHSHAAVLAEWLTDDQDRVQRPDTRPPGPEATDHTPSPSGYRAILSAVVTNFNPASLSFVMGTGIVSTGLYVNGAGTASAVLLWAALAGFAALVPACGWWMLRRRRRFVAAFVGPRSFVLLTLAISSNVLAARLVLDGHTSVAAAFLAFGTLGWLVLDYAVPLALITTVKRAPSLDQANGTWFLWAVGSESVAVAAAALARTTHGQALAVLAVVCWGIGLLQYLLTAPIVLTRLLARPVQPDGLLTSVWIFMGAAAIAVLATVRIMALPPGDTLLSRPLLVGVAVVLWAFSSWLIPLLLALGVWRHVLRRIPLRYEVGWWNLVFPIGMYAVTTHELGRAAGTSWMTGTGRWEIWLAAVVWAMVVAAMAAARFPRATSGRKSGTARALP